MKTPFYEFRYELICVWVTTAEDMNKFPRYQKENELGSLTHWIKECWEETVKLGVSEEG